jgi:hypothetical protein
MATKRGNEGGDDGPKRGNEEHVTKKSMTGDGRERGNEEHADVDHAVIFERVVEEGENDGEVTCVGKTTKVVFNEPVTKLSAAEMDEVGVLVTTPTKKDMTPIKPEEVKALLEENHPVDLTPGRSVDFKSWMRPLMADGSSLVKKGP